jgi:hypothetical protein
MIAHLPLSYSNEDLFLCIRFKLPEPYAAFGATLVTFSYSLSMIDNPYPSVDNAKRLLAADGFLGWYTRAACFFFPACNLGPEDV